MLAVHCFITAFNFRLRHVHQMSPPVSDPPCVLSDLLYVCMPCFLGGLTNLLSYNCVSAMGEAYNNSGPHRARSLSSQVAPPHHLGTSPPLYAWCMCMASGCCHDRGCARCLVSNSLHVCCVLLVPCANCVLFPTMHWLSVIFFQPPEGVEKSWCDRQIFNLHIFERST